MKWLMSRTFFTWWFGLGFPPFLFGTFYLSFLISPAWGYATIIFTAIWLFDSFFTTCRRCQFYGTAKCGIPGLLVPHLLKKKSPFSISINRIKLHFYLEIAFIFYIHLVYLHFPVLFPFVAVGAFGAWLIVYRKKRFHGLLWRLNEKSLAREAGTVQVILPMAELERVR